MREPTQPSLSLEQACGQLIVAGFEGLAEPTPAIKQALERGQIGGVILFRRNVDPQDIAQVKQLNEAIHRAAARAIAPPLVCLDQEGGRVRRLRDPVTLLPPMRQIGDHGDLELTEAISAAIASEIAALGFNFNCAPVLDVDTNPENPIIGDRAFSSLPQQVAQLGLAWARGHQRAGVIPCGKHFPGHGDTDQDSHLTLPTVHRDRAGLDRIELLPFREAVEAKIPAIMTAHIVMPALDPSLPATLSPTILRDLLRGQMGYQGVVISDDLEMKAVANRYSTEQLVRLGLRAGLDIFLICHTEQKWQAAYQCLLELGQNNEEDRARIFAAAARVLALKDQALASAARPWRASEDWREKLGPPAHAALLARLEEQDSPEDQAADVSDPTVYVPDS